MKLKENGKRSWQRMFIDTNVFILLYLKSSSPQAANAKKLFERIYSGQEKAVTNVLVLNELFYFFAERSSIEKVEKIARHISSLPNLSILPIDAHIAMHSVEFMKKGLQASDAFHAATMKTHHLETICSYDKAFDTVAGIKRLEPK